MIIWIIAKIRRAVGEKGNNMSNFNQWENKQLIDVISKGVNSVLMNREPKAGELERISKELKEIYVGLLKELKADRVVSATGEDYIDKTEPRLPLRKGVKPTDASTPF
jgi:hypothetical protein